ASARVDDRTSGTDYARKNRRHVRPDIAQLHDRDHDARALHPQQHCGARLRDETGILWRKSWTFRGVAIGSWSAVEVINGSAEADGSRKRYFLRVPSRMRTAREAVAWTYGLTGEQYAKLEIRTY